jgi:hypothetical protein
MSKQHVETLVAPAPCSPEQSSNFSCALRIWMKKEKYLSLLSALRGQNKVGLMRFKTFIIFIEQNFILSMFEYGKNR